MLKVVHVLMLWVMIWQPLKKVKRLQSFKTLHVSIFLCPIGFITDRTGATNLAAWQKWCEEDGSIQTRKGKQTAYKIVLELATLKCNLKLLLLLVPSIIREAVSHEASLIYINASESPGILHYVLGELTCTEKMIYNWNSRYLQFVNTGRKNSFQHSKTSVSNFSLLCFVQNWSLIF